MDKDLQPVDDSSLLQDATPEPFSSTGINTGINTGISTAFLPPSVIETAVLSGATYSHYSAVPPSLLPPPSDPHSIPPPCMLGVDEAGRGPVLGPMVYSVFYLPLPLSDSLLRQSHHFDDSKALTPAVRASLVAALCDPASDLFASCGWATTALSARDIGASMLAPTPYNLNAQAMDATADLIRGVLARGVNVAEIYVDTIGSPAVYQARLQKLFPAAKVTVAKKADSLYPCVSAASVCAKVTRDVALEVLHAERRREEGDDDGGERREGGMEWGSGYPSDGKCVAWLKKNMHPLFGWGPECRFSWGTAKDMLEAKPNPVKVEWPEEDDGEVAKLTTYFSSAKTAKDANGLGSWFGGPVGLETF